MTLYDHPQNETARLDFDKWANEKNPPDIREKLDRELRDAQRAQGIKIYNAAYTRGAFGASTNPAYSRMTRSASNHYKREMCATAYCIEAQEAIINALAFLPGWERRLKTLLKRGMRRDFGLFINTRQWYFNLLKSDFVPQFARLDIMTVILSIRIGQSW